MFVGKKKGSGRDFYLFPDAFLTLDFHLVSLTDSIKRNDHLKPVQSPLLAILQTKEEEKSLISSITGALKRKIALPVDRVLDNL